MAIRVRKYKPAPTDEYGDYRDILRDDFDYSCAYCNITETELGNLRLFHIDHYRPQKNPRFPQFAKLKNAYDNLLYSCFDCNEHKGNFWPDLLHKAFHPDHYVINPCDEDAELHLNKSQPLWTHITKTGEWNIKRLHLRDELKLRCRKARESHHKKLQQAQQHRAKAQTMLSTALSSHNQTAADFFLESIGLANAAIDECHKFLNRKLA